MGTTTYSPIQTHRELLEAAYQEIWHNGFRAASLDSILTKTGFTKGALYHHFGTKSDLGYAVVDEIIRPQMQKKWFDPLLKSKNPIDTLMYLPRQFTQEEIEDYCTYGCPLNNLAQELSPVDEGFRIRINAIYREWIAANERALSQGQQEGTVRDNIDPHGSAIFIIALIEGAIGISKSAQSPAMFQPCLTGMGHYLEALRPRRSFRTEI